jgi:hypothetical protein
MMNNFTIFMDWDAEAQKWYAQNDDIPIMLEDASLDTLIARVKLAAPEMLALHGQRPDNVHLLFKTGKKTYLVNGNYYIINSETGNIKRLIVQDESSIPFEDLKQLALLLAEALARKE